MNAQDVLFVVFCCLIFADAWAHHASGKEAMDRPSVYLLPLVGGWIALYDAKHNP